MYLPVDMLCTVQIATPEVRLLWQYMLYILIHMKNANGLCMVNSECFESLSHDDPTMTIHKHICMEPHLSFVDTNTGDLVFVDHLRLSS